MVQLTLADGAYQARSVIASAQRCVNMWPEANQLNTTLYLPSQMTNSITTHYPRAGLTLLATIGTGPIRGAYFANNGSLYVASGSGLYFVNSQFQATLLGTIDPGTTPVVMADNSETLVLVDGTPNGYTVSLFDFFQTITTVEVSGQPTVVTSSLSTTGTVGTVTSTVDGVTTTAVTTFLAANQFSKINDPAFFGADGVDYIDTFMFFNKPGTPQFYSTTSQVVTPFDALFFANKTGYGDNLVRAVEMHREIWLIGDVSTEVWFDAGNATFPFSEVPGAFIQYGCCAKYSVAVKDQAVFWLSQDKHGNAFVLSGANYSVSTISTRAIENEFQKYATISDAIGFVYQQGGHIFYVLTFPTADKTWVYDNTSQLWHEEMWLGPDGLEHRIRPMCSAFAYNKNVCGDRENGNLYFFDVNNQTDNGAPIQRIRSFPTMQNELKRISYQKFTADMQVGSDPNNEPPNEVMVGLRYSDTGGQSWSDMIYQTIGSTGQFQTNMQWRRLGLGRRRVFELSWSAPVPTALNGAYIDVTPCAT
jgi:hypothetical protein